MKETFECPCKKEETILVRIYDEYDESAQRFLRLSPQTKRLLEFLEEEDLLTVSVEWDFDIDSLTKEF